MIRLNYRGLEDENMLSLIASFLLAWLGLGLLGIAIAIAAMIGAPEESVSATEHWQIGSAFELRHRVPAEHQRADED